MDLVYIFSGNYAGFKDSLLSSHRRTGCEVKVYEQAETFPLWQRVTAQTLPHCDAPWQTTCIARWFLLRDFIKSGAVKLPVFCSDWDILFFTPLEAACEPFKDCDCAYSVERDSGHPSSSSAYLINQIEPLEAFFDNVSARWVKPKGEGFINDMTVWSEVAGTGRFKFGDMFEVRKGSVFDHNIACGRDRFLMDGNNKKVIWQDYGGVTQPCFIGLDGVPVVAHTIHCWGSYKTRTGELLKLAGIK